MPDLLPLFPLGTVLFPGMPLPLHVFEPRYRQLVHDLLEQPEPRQFGVVAIRAGHEVGAESLKALYDVGCTATVTELQRAPDGRFGLMTLGTQRFRVLRLDHTRPYLQAEVEALPESADGAIMEAGRVRELFGQYAGALGRTDVAGELPDAATALSYVVARALAVPLPERQDLLELDSTAERLAAEADILRREIALMQQLHTMPITGPPPPPSHLN